MLKKEETVCQFCNLKNKQKFITESAFVIAVPAFSPISKGHTLIYPKEHFVNFLELTESLKIECLEVSKRVKKILDCKYSPVDYEIKINISGKQKQNYSHTALNLIPAYL